MRQPIQAGDELDRNYQIRLRMDMLRSGTRTYNALANSTGTSFTLGVVLHDVVHYPIEMTASPHAVGGPGERVRLDLTLGIDSDGDGIPDAWEQSQLYAGGFLPDENGWDLSLIGRNGDFDHDGVSNWDEYIAGTYATDPTDYLTLQITARFPHSVRLGFYGIHGKTYSLEVSSDLQTWLPADLYLSNPADPHEGPDDPNTSARAALDYETDDFNPSHPPLPQNGWSADLTGVIQLYTLAETSQNTYYRLKVR
ncbi:hypothetical protein [Haloferula sargassicola]|uniref:hypothetical protein n=1 Tax=Haloferula sargassicola TaxID=490096 RepID=UPI00336563EA